MIRVESQDLDFETDDETLNYFVEIVENMMTRFGITSREAIGRINSEFSPLKKITEEDDYGLYREFPAYWACDIYFGHQSYWWVDKLDRIKLGLQNLEPKPYTGPK